MGLYI